MENLIIILLVVSAFYGHGTDKNIWFKLGKLSKKYF